MIKRIYFDLPLEVLITMQTETIAAIQKATQGQSVSVPDFSVSYATIENLKNQLAEINAAIKYNQGKYNPFGIGAFSKSDL